MRIKRGFAFIVLTSLVLITHATGKSLICRLGVLVIIVGLTSCEDVVRISLVDDAPTFEFSGSGYVDLFFVIESEPNQEPKPFGDKSRVLWEIFPDSTTTGTLPVRRITYGKVPAGFHQTIPENGPPPPLKGGTTYQAGAPPFAHRYGSIHFKLKDGKAIAVE